MKDELLRALDLADAGDWNGSHNISQQIEHRISYWLHANLHREEGDNGNAGYWYERIDMKPVTGDFKAERAAIRAEILKGLWNDEIN